MADSVLATIRREASQARQFWQRHYLEHQVLSTTSPLSSEVVRKLQEILAEAKE